MKTKRKPKPAQIKRLHMTAAWEILSTAEMVIEKYAGAPVPEHELANIYKGMAIPCIVSGVISSKQKWGVTISTITKDDNGTIYPAHEVAWRIDEPMTFADFMNGNPEIKVNRGGGLKTRWQGVAAEWLKMVDEDLEGLIAITAHATANCLAEVANWVDGPTRRLLAAQGAGNTKAWRVEA